MTATVRYVLIGQEFEMLLTGWIPGHDRLDSQLGAESQPTVLSECNGRIRLNLTGYIHALFSLQLSLLIMSFWIWVPQ